MKLYGHTWWTITWFHVIDIEIGNDFALDNAGFCIVVVCIVNMTGDIL